MKYFLLLFLFLALQNDSETDYNLLIGSWMQKSYNNTTNTGIFTFASDSIVTLEMKEGDSGTMIASAKVKYGLNRKQKTLTISMMGTLKTFTIVNLKPDVLTIKNITDNKPAQTFERYDQKEEE